MLHAWPNVDVPRSCTKSLEYTLVVVELPVTLQVGPKPDHAERNSNTVFNALCTGRGWKRPGGDRLRY